MNAAHIFAKFAHRTGLAGVDIEPARAANDLVVYKDGVYTSALDLVVELESMYGKAPVRAAARFLAEIYS